MVIEVGEGFSPSAESGQAPCLWSGAYSLRDGHAIGRDAALRKVGVPFFILPLRYCYSTPVLPKPINLLILLRKLSSPSSLPRFAR